ncbi:MAG: hypothetical protein AAFY91_01145 [Bacteroidota bacterium]
MKYLLSLFILSLLAFSTPMVAQEAMPDESTIANVDESSFPSLNYIASNFEIDQDEPSIDPPFMEDDDGDKSFLAKLWDWLMQNGAELVLILMTVIEFIVRLTPTERDNAWFLWLKNFIGSFIPNNKAGGGTHP